MDAAAEAPEGIVWRLDDRLVHDVVGGIEKDRQSRLIHEGRIGCREENDSFLTFTTQTPWGRTQQIASANVLPVLSLIGGRTCGWSLIEKLAGTPVKLPDQQALVRGLERWRKAASGEPWIDGTATVSDIVQTLYRQRFPAYDEPGLTRMLVRLRRQAVIGLREAKTAPELYT